LFSGANLWFACDKYHKIHNNLGGGDKVHGWNICDTMNPGDGMVGYTTI